MEYRGCEMKLYSVTASWRNKGERKSWLKTAVIIAETEEEAVTKFKKNVSYPKDAYVRSSVWEDGIFTLSERRGF